MESNLSAALSLTGCTVMWLVGVFGNMLIIWTYYAVKRIQTLQNMFVVSLAGTDLVLIGYILSFHMLDLIYGNPVIPRQLCFFNTFVACTCFICGIHTIMHISINRYVKICRPAGQYIRLYTRRRTILMILSCWLMGLIYSIPLVLAVGIDDIYDQTLMVCGVSRQGDNPYMVILFILSFALPILITTYCYLAITKHVWDGRRQLSRHWNNGLAFQRFQNDVRAAKLHSLIFVVYLALYIPLSVISTVTSTSTDVPVDIQKMGLYLCFANSCVNCLLYGVFNKKTRLAYKEVLKVSQCKLCLKKNIVQPVEMANVRPISRVSQDGENGHMATVMNFQTATTSC